MYRQPVAVVLSGTPLYFYTGSSFYIEKYLFKVPLDQKKSYIILIENM